MDLTNWVQEIFGPTEPQKELHLKSATEAPNSILVVDFAALAAGGAGLAQRPQPFLPTGGPPRFAYPGSGLIREALGVSSRHPAKART